MTIFRAIGVSSSATGKVDDKKRPLYKADVQFMEINTDPATTRVLSQQGFTVLDEADLVTQCRVVLDQLKTRHEAARQTIDIAKRTLAEVQTV